jgi:mannose-6-phosphate isomerase-like protein (cupin superfamily)
MAQESNQQYHFSSEQILDQAIAEGKLYGEYLNNETLSSGIYHLKTGTIDPQQPHQFDEIYYVIAGIATLKMNDMDYPAKAGDILFVPAKVKHQFIEIQEDLTLLVFFSKKEPRGNE